MTRRGAKGTKGNTNDTNESEGHERGVLCFVAFVPFRGFRVSDSPADKEPYLDGRRSPTEPQPFAELLLIGCTTSKPLENTPGAFLLGGVRPKLAL
jgi:hypothetical protein